MFLHRFRRLLLPAGIVALMIGATAPVIAQQANAAASAPTATHAARHVPTPHAPRSGKQVPHLAGTTFQNAARKATRQSGAARWAQLTARAHQVASKPKAPSRPSAASSGIMRTDLTSWSGTFHADWGVYPNETIYGAEASQQVDSFTLPSSSGDTIYSPTLDPSNISCIEVTTVYVAGADYVGAWNWCASSPGWGVLTADNTSSFQANYTTVTSGRRFYTFQDIQTNASTNQWTAYLYNYSTGKWDTFFQSANTSRLSQSGGGWDIDEVYTTYDASTLSGTYCNQIGSADWESTLVTYLIGGSWVAASPANANASYPSGLDIGCPAAHFTTPNLNGWHTGATGTHAAAAIIGAGSEKCLDVPGANFTNGQVVDISTCNGSSQQSWTYTSTGELTTDGGKYCLEVYNSATANNSEVDIWTCNNTQTQEWTWSIYNALVGTNSGLCLDVPGAATADGTALDIYDCVGGATNEQWTWPPPPSAPAVTTSAASGVTGTAATLNGTVNPEGAATTYQFQYGTSTSYGSVTPASPASAGSGRSAVGESAGLSGLSASTTYDYRLVATNATGTTNGSNQTFTTPAASPPGNAFTPVGGLIQGTSLTPSVTAQAAGDVILLHVITEGNAPPTGISGGGTTWKQVGSTLSGSVNSGFSAAVYEGTVTAAGTAQATVTTSGAPSAVRIGGQEYNPGSGQTGVLVSQANLDVTGTSTGPSITPTGSNEFYSFYGFDTGTGSAGSTPGYTYELDDNGNVYAFDPASPAQPPVFGDSNVAFGIAVLMQSAPPGSP
jgi:hypothetical protein